MKNTLFFALILSLFAQTGCKEKDFPMVQISNQGKRVVVAEELTGVRCPNCPDGTVELVKLDSLYGDRLIVISLHAAFPYYFPYTQSKDTFFLAEAENVTNFIGSYLGFPAASINRKKSATSLYDFNDNAAAWGGLVASYAAIDPKVSLYMENDYDETTRTVDVKVQIAPEDDQESGLHLTVLLTQDSIVDTQNDHGVIRDDYLHRHVLRTFLSPFDGTPIGEPLTAGTLVEKTYSFTLPAKWHAGHCAIVAFLHRAKADDKEILQAVEHHVVE